VQRRGVVGILLALSVVLACASPPPGSSAPSDVVYEAGGTDDAWITIDGAMAMVSDALAPQLTSPTAAISRSGSAPTFVWTAGIVGGPTASDGGTTIGLAPLRSRVLHELFPVAHAHLPPVTGAMFGLTFDLGSGVTPLRVLTGATSYTPFGISWQRLSTATSPVTLRITGTYLNTGRIEQGPYVRSAPATFMLQ